MTEGRKEEEGRKGERRKVRNERGRKEGTYALVGSNNSPSLYLEVGRKEDISKEYQLRNSKEKLSRKDYEELSI